MKLSKAFIHVLASELLRHCCCYCWRCCSWFGLYSLVLWFLFLFLFFFINTYNCQMKMCCQSLSISPSGVVTLIIISNCLKIYFTYIRLFLVFLWRERCCCRYGFSWTIQRATCTLVFIQYFFFKITIDYVVVNTGRNTFIWFQPRFSI